jgi:hypothetical protein
MFHLATLPPPSPKKYVAAFLDKRQKMAFIYASISRLHKIRLSSSWKIIFIK